jgi:hypothetical protein
MNARMFSRRSFTDVHEQDIHTCLLRIFILTASEAFRILEQRPQSEPI